ncbi:SbcC/MukB-like Walker B domain-containing protein [Lysobacter yangpyeongensis]|uniref:SbcC/MukB-like Walker B domain-containing protein n=1 Tax=Lysobacter yangpyeongensis TaxID=346182 RepID=A0ABW0SPF7_9GAMM
MYLLEEFHLVQFFLFTAQTIHFHASSGIVAPNGSGKSALLDGMQIVLHGGDQHQIDLNAQSGGASGDRGRSIREYCLGYYRGDEHVRKNANTYLTMVFRDSTGKMPPVSVGIAMGASEKEPKHRIYGRYIADVALTIEDHLENAANGDVLPLSWPSFLAALEDKVKAAKGRLSLPKTAADHVESMLFRLRPTGASSTSPKAFVRAIKNALNLKTVKDASAFVRDYIIDARPIDLKDFRDQLETFRTLQGRVEEVIERIGKCDGMLEVGKKAKHARMQHATYKAMVAELERDLHMERYDEVVEQLEKAQENLAQAKRDAEKAKLASERLNQAYVEVEKQSANDPALQAARNHLQERENLLVPIKRNLATTLRRIVASYANAANKDPGIGGWSFLCQPWQELLSAISGANGAEDLTVDREGMIKALRQSATQTQPLLEKAKQDEAEARRRLQELQLQFRSMTEQLKRADEGKAIMEGPLGRVYQLLADEGIDSTPVCDLVSVKDPDWAPAIESFLGKSTTALLIEPGRLNDALAIYSRIPAGHNPHEVLIVKPPKSPVDLSTLPQRAIAHLIEGSNEIAVSYLRGKLGRRVQLDRVTQDSPEGFTREGVSSNAADFGRRRPAALSELVLGRQDQRARKERLTRERQLLTEQLEEADRSAQKLKGVLAVIEDLQSLGSRVEDVEGWLLDHEDKQRSLASQAALSSLANSPDLIATQQLIFDAKKEWIKADELKVKLSKLEGQYAHAVETAQQEFDRLSAATDAIARKAADSMRLLHVDAAWMQAKREEYEKQERSLQWMISKCRENQEAATGRVESHSSELRAQVNQYAGQYPFEITADISDLDALVEMVTEEQHRLKDSELARYQQLAKDAYEGSVRTFRSRIAASLRDSFNTMDATLYELNRAMDRLPPFSNNEKYHFRREINPSSRALYDFIIKAADVGADDDMFKDPVNTPEEFRLMLEGKDVASAYLLEDYRHFFNFEVEVRNAGVRVTDFAKRMDKGSGGEHRAPLFIVAGAAMANALGKLKGDTTGMSLIIFDELGDKIDSTNTRAVFEYLKSLGLQPIVAAPDDALGKINESVEGYVEMYRDDDLLTVKHVRIGEDGQILLDSDNWRKHPHLLEDEIRLVEQERSGAEEVA